KQIFSVDIHPDCTKFATGGQGTDCGLVVIWNLLPLINAKAERDAKVPKRLCQMDQHLACVNCVRWSHNGLCLASGSDDKVIMIWRKTTGSSGVFGTGGMQENIESWKCFYTLRGHNGDVLDLAWSPNDLYLASCSVDNMVIIWDAQAFPHITVTLKGHTGLVKGVTWDPVGSYLATQSDDRSVCIWSTDGWKLSHKITEPFEECGGTTHILRLSWSPDGQYLVSAHAMNSGVPTAQIIEREGWRCDKDFVGHRKAVTCVRFHNSILLRSPENNTIQYCCLAVGSRDRSLSVWMTNLQRPMFVIHELFQDSVLDLSWGRKECLLLACSGDGTIACLQFDDQELGFAKPDSERDIVMRKIYGMGYGDGLAATKETNANVTSALDSNAISFPGEAGQRPKTNKQTETRTKDGKRRITPMFIPLHEEGPMPSLEHTLASTKKPEVIAPPVPVTPSGPTPMMPEPLVSKADQGRLDSRLKPQGNSSRRQSHPADLEDMPILPRIEDHQGTTSGPANVQVTANGKSEFAKSALGMRVHIQNGYLTTTGLGMLAKVTASDAKEMLWESYVGSPIVNLNLCEKYVMLCSLDGTMRLLSMETGCAVFPAMSLLSCGVHCAFSPNNYYVAVLTESGKLRVWNIDSRVLHMGASCSELGTTHGPVVQFSVTDRGLPLIGLKSGHAYSYSTDMQSWLVMATKDAIMFHGIKGTLPRDMEHISQQFPVLDMQASSSNYFSFSAGMELRKALAWQKSAKIVFIENQIKLCETLQSIDELKHWHRMLTFQLATYGTEKRMRQFLDDLLEDPEPGVPVFVPKQELMQCVLDTLKPHTQWQLMYAEYVDLFKTSKAQREEELFATPKVPKLEAKEPAPEPEPMVESPLEPNPEPEPEPEPKAKAKPSPPPAVASATGTTNTTSSSSGSSTTSSSSSSSSSAPPTGLSPADQVLVDEDSRTAGGIDDELCSASSASLPPMETSASPPDLAGPAQGSTPSSSSKADAT
ncbi:hypothetical protein KR018_005858, partial [Drosophila ironensis]